MMYQKTLPAALAVALLSACPGPAAAPVAAQATLQATKQIPVGKTPHGMGATAGFVYNSDVGDARLSVIDTASDAVVTTIPFPDGKPGYVKPFHDGKHVLVTDTVKGEVLVIDPAQGHQVLQRVAVGSGPDKLRVGDDDRQVVVSLTNESKVVMLTFEADRSRPPARKEFAVGSVSGEGTGKHRDTAFAAGWLVVPNTGENTVSLIDAASGETRTLATGNHPAPVGIGLAGASPLVALVGNQASNTVTLYQLPGGEATTLSDVGLSPTDMVIDAELGRAFITMAGSNELTVIDYVARQVVGKVPVGARPVHAFMAPVLPPAAQRRLLDHPKALVSHEIWVCNDDGASVTVVDGASLRVKATIATGEGHHKMAFAGGKAYVSNIKVNTVSVIDRAAIR